VADAQVTLLVASTPREERRTDAQGHYEFRGLGPGAYKLVALAAGFASSSATVEISEKGPRRLDLHLALSAVEQHVVVSASLGGAPAPEVGSSVSVIGRQDMENRDAQNVYEVLRGVPGVEVNQTGRRGGVTSVFIRGGDSDYNLVMVDGIEVNEFGGDFDFASLPADGVEQVEVVRNPESALYGSNAVTGVVNIISRRGDGPPRFDAEVEGGSFTTQRYATGGSGLTRGWSWAYDVSRLESGGVVPNDHYRDQSAIFSLGYSRSPKDQFNFHFFGNANDAGAPGPFGSDPDHLFTGIDTVSRDKQNLYGFRWSYARQFTAHLREVLSGTLALNDYFFISPYGDSYSNNLRGTINSLTEAQLAPSNFLVGGFEWNREQFQDTYVADNNGVPFLLPRTSLAYFAEDRWTPARGLFLIGGLRVDDIRTSGLPYASGVRPPIPASSITKINPRISLAYLIRDPSEEGATVGATRLHASFGTGIRAPNGFELASTNNPRLKPEKSLSLDFGAEQRWFANRAVLDATYFYNRFDDQIVVLGGSLTHLSAFSSDNLGNSRAEGMELSFRAHPARSVQFTAEYTFDGTEILALSGSKDLALAPFQVGQELFRRPRNSGFYDVTWHHRSLTLNTTAYIRGQVLDIEPNYGTFTCEPVSEGGFGLPCLFTNKGYTRADAGFSYRLWPGVEIYGRLKNFLNQKYEESLGYPALHINFLAGARFNLPPE
jgi:outer membrane cobalamin receptor